MNRRNFIKDLSVIGVAAMVAPSLLKELSVATEPIVPCVGRAFSPFHGSGKTAASVLSPMDVMMKANQVGKNIYYDEMFLENVENHLKLADFGKGKSNGSKSGRLTFHSYSGIE